MIVIDFLITFFAYMFIPFVYFFILGKKKSKKKIILLNFINSFIIMLIFMSIRLYLGENNLYSGAPSFLYWIINNFIYCRYSLNNDADINVKDNKTIKSYDKLKEAKNNKLKVGLMQKSTLTLSISLIISIIFNISVLIFSINLKIKNDEILSNLDSLRDDFYYLIGTNTQSYMKEKIHFMDNKIVFIIDGYDEYYFSYDCVQVIKNHYNDLKGSVILKDAAIDIGYKEYICN